jgi:hypothetical protein
MTTRMGPRVWGRRLARGVAALGCALLAVLATTVVAGAGSPTSQHSSHASHTTSVTPALGRPPLLEDDPTPPALGDGSGGGRDRTRAPGALTPPCARASVAARPPQGSGGDHPAPAAAAAPCAAPPPPPPVPVLAQPAPLRPLLGAHRAVATPSPAPQVAPVALPVTASTPQALPVPPPLWLAPGLLPAPARAAVQVAPTSVLLLGFGSVALATAVMTLRLLRRGR